MEKKKILLLLAVFAIFAVAAFMASRSPSTGIATQIPQDRNGNFVVIVSSQSFAIDPVDITVSIDDKVAVSEFFYVGDQHNNKAFSFNLPEGSHRIGVSSVKGGASAEKDFEMTGKKWATVSYWYYTEKESNPTPKHFSINMLNEPPMFQ